MPVLGSEAAHRRESRSHHFHAERGLGRVLEAFRGLEGVDGAGVGGHHPQVDVSRPTREHTDVGGGGVAGRHVPRRRHVQRDRPEGDRLRSSGRGWARDHRASRRRHGRRSRRRAIGGRAGRGRGRGRHLVGVGTGAGREEDQRHRQQRRRRPPASRTPPHQRPRGRVDLSRSASLLASGSASGAGRRRLRPMPLRAGHGRRRRLVPLDDLLGDKWAHP